MNLVTRSVDRCEQVETDILIKSILHDASSHTCHKQQPDEVLTERNELG